MGGVDPQGWADGELAELDAAAVQELAPTETLRAGVVQAPLAGVFFVGLRPDGTPFGTTVTLFEALARHIARPVTFHVFPNSGECTEAVATGAVDVAFMPVDEYRRERVAFGPGYFELESTFLVSAASGITTLAGVDRDGVRVVGIDGTTTIRAAARSLAHTVPVPVRGVEEAFAMLRDGRADAVALSRDSLEQVVGTMPGSRIVPGGFQRTSVSVAVPPERPGALEVVSTWLNGAVENGTVAAALARPV